MPNRTWKPLTILLVLAMILSFSTAFMPNVAAGDPSVTGTVKSAVDPFGTIQGVKVMYAGDSGVFINTTTNAGGHFSIFIAGGPKESFNLTFTSDEYTDRTVGYNTSIYYGGDVALTNDTGLVPLPKIMGTLMELGTSNELADVEVTIDNDVEITGALGKFEKYVAPGTYDIFYKKDGYYNNQNESVAVAEDKDIGTIYLEKIEPTPTIVVWGVVTDKDTGSKIEGAEVAISKGDDKWISSLTDADGKYSMLAYAGTFQVKAMKTGYETNVSNDWWEIPANIRWDIDLEKIPTEEWTLTGKVVDEIAAPIQFADVYLHSANYVNHTQTDATGDYTMMYNGTYKLQVMKDGYFTEVFPWDITLTNDSVALDDIVLTQINEDHELWGYVEDNVENTWIVGAEITIYDMNHTYSQTVTSNDKGHYQFMVHDEANYTLVVNADGYQAEAYKILDIQGDTPQDLLLTPSPSDTIRTTFVFGNWTTINVTEVTTMVVDNVSARVDADRRWGMGPLGLDNNNWILSAGEETDWENYLENKGIEQSDTSDVLTLNDMFYELPGAVNVAISGAAGDITTGTAVITITKDYVVTLVGEDDEDADREVIINASYDTDFVDYIYEIVPPLTPVQYELSWNTTETTFVDVYGYNDPITIDPHKSIGDSERVALGLEASLAGEAVISIEDGLYHELNSTKEGYEVIVSAPQTNVDTAINFSAQGSIDFVGDINAANFTWDFGGDATADAYGMETFNNYSTAGLFTTNLTITQVGGNVTYHNITVHVDGIVPTAVISVNTSDDNVTFVAASKNLAVNEDIELTFNGTDSADTIAAGDSTPGIIEKYFWVWGDDTANSTVTMGTDINITHTYNVPDTYTLTLTTTDIMGHESVNDTWTIIVNDITAPVIPEILMFNASMGEIQEGIENHIIYFGANQTIDNKDVLAELNFTWDIEYKGNHTISYGNWTSFTPENVGDHNVTLVAKDLALNSKNYTKVVNIRVGDRPNLDILESTFTFDPEEGSVGQTITLSVNITNTGDTDATAVTVSFFVREAGGTDTPITGTVSIVVNDTATTTIPAGETATASVAWKPGSKGTYTLYVNCSTPDEHSSQWLDNDNEGFFEYSTKIIKEAGWVIYAIILGGIGVLVLIFVGARFFMGARAGGDIGRGDKRKKK